MLKEIPRAIHTKKVFLSAKGRPIPYWTGYLNQVWQNTLKGAGIEDACFHDLRHDFVTRAMRSGNASHVVMKQVGHKTDSMLRRYQLVDERDLMELRIETSTLTQEQITYAATDAWLILRLYLHFGVALQSAIDDVDTDDERLGRRRISLSRERCRA